MNKDFPSLPPVAPPPFVNPISNTEERKVPNQQAQRVDKIALPKIKEMTLWEKLCHKLNVIVTWLKSIPSKIFNVFRCCFKDSHEDFDEFVEDDDEEYIGRRVSQEMQIFPHPTNSTLIGKEAPPIIENPLAQRSFLDELEANVSQLRLKVELLETDSMVDKEALKKTNSKINNLLDKISNLPASLKEGETDNKISAWKNTLKTAQKKLELIRSPQQVVLPVKIESEFADFLQEVKNSLETAKGQRVQKTLNMPPVFKNKKNNCWFHAAIQLVWAMGDSFHQLVAEKYQERSILVDTYNKEMDEYNECLLNYPTKCEQRKQLLLDQLKALKNFRKELKAYSLAQKRAEAEYRRTFQRYEVEKEAWDIYLEEKKRWQAADHATAPPVKPQDNEPVPPVMENLAFPKAPEVEIEEIIQKPKLPSEPIDPTLLLDSIHLLSEALQLGNQDAITSAAKCLEKATPLLDAEFVNRGAQYDADVFITALFSYLSSPFFKVEKEIKGLPGTIFKDISHFREDSTSILRLLIPTGHTNFQEVLNEAYSPQVFDKEPGCSFDREENGEVRTVTQYSEQERLVEIKERGFILVHVKRYKYFVSTQRKDKYEQLINNRAKQLIKKDRASYISKEEAKKAALEMLKEEKLIPPSYPQTHYESRKISTPLNFPNNHRINFSQAFKEQTDKDYEYELVGAVLQEGTLNAGHYKANVMGVNPHSGESQWYHADDLKDHIASFTLSEAQASNRNGYIYLFKKVAKAKDPSPQAPG
ncbi:hypothetical protein DB42_BB00210 [Neochlamydia sp. EPS4]|uniref:hypothetical protein n=1 Tax=Neochlamydia sp. EPS4 TaxID=1478175 RepID=UPI000582AB43|nr:hypothetical protein [Neochlamydia sp. EPS4]KIC74594.1 hypothetical protein DB42_BB00210 [Neochlamydia sp. EPS4]